jgi:uncharacterized protein YdhG (YjbR/CyaY superfamily)
MKRTPAKDVDAYVADAPEEMRAPIEKLRQVIRAAAPKAEEVISYQVPCYKHGGMLVGFAAFQKHYSLFVASLKLMASLKRELKPYTTAKATIHFLPGKPLPVALVKKIVKARIAENDARMAAKAKAKKAR